VAPRSSTVDSVGATRSIAFSTCCISGLPATIRAAPEPSTGARVARIARILERSRSLSHGLVM
jgi:hypothetical protein